MTRNAQECARASERALSLYCGRVLVSIKLSVPYLWKHVEIKYNFETRWSNELNFQAKLYCLFFWWFSNFPVDQLKLYFILFGS